MIEAQYRTFWRRFWAGLVDWFVVTPLCLLLGQLMGIWGVAVSPPIRALWQIVGCLCAPAYSILLHGKYDSPSGK